MSEADEAGRIIAPVPRVTIEAFCETPGVEETVQAAARDRRLQRAEVAAAMGGAAAALERYRHQPTPGVIVLESGGHRGKLLEQLDSLAEVCDAGTKVIVIGHVNDVLLYRELTRRGVSDYLIAPLATLELVQALSDLFHGSGADSIGRTVAVLGAKGGVGASTIAHNLAWTMARKLATAAAIVDLDVAFGTAGLDFNQDPPQGIAEAVFAPERLDSNVVERLMTKCGDNLSLLAASAMLDRTVDLSETALDQLIDILRASTASIVLDMPHLWTAWARRTIVSADEVVIVAAPELASLRNAKNLLDVLRTTRPNDRRPRIVLNGTGVPKRPEIAATEFAKALDCELAAVVPFDAQLFGTAANNGQMVAEVQSGGKVSELFVGLAASITGRSDAKSRRASVLDPIIAKFTRRKAS